MGLESLDMFSRAKVLREAVRVNASSSCARIGYKPLRNFCEANFMVKVDNHMLSSFLARREVRSEDGFTSKQIAIIMGEANKLNGTRETPDGLIHLAEFAALNCEVLVQTFTLRRLLQAKADKEEVWDTSARRWCRRSNACRVYRRSYHRKNRTPKEG
jgi:hypothetical protein